MIDFSTATNTQLRALYIALVLTTIMANRDNWDFTVSSSEFKRLSRAVEVTLIDRGIF